MNYLKVISRKSQLAVLQVKEVFVSCPGVEYELLTLETYGDKHKEISLLENPPADLFTRELDIALLEDTADIAIHSAKDLPYPLPAGLEVIALLEAFDQTDSLVSQNNILLKDMPAGSKVGVSSLLRRKELLAMCPDVEAVSIRGSIDERIALVDSGSIDAFIVASNALLRLGLSDKVAEVLPFETPPLQGKLAVVAKTGRPELKALFEKQDIRPRFGKVTLVGFGPGDPDLLTIAGDRSLGEADVIFLDDLVDRDFLDRYKAEKFYVGKRRHCHSFEQDQINQLMLVAAMEGKKVVRLKGGDSMIFAHGGEEVEFLKSNFIPVKVIPGISTGTAVASLTQIPLTLRGIAKSVAFITGHAADVQLPVADTLVCFMAGSTIHLIAAKAIAEGRDPNTPVALVYNVSLPDQEEYLSTLELLSRSDFKYPTPIIIIIGEVVSFRKNR